jgi:hypothetical protein
MGRHLTLAKMRDAAERLTAAIAPFGCRNRRVNLCLASGVLPYGASSIRLFAHDLQPLHTNDRSRDRDRVG